MRIKLYKNVASALGLALLLVMGLASGETEEESQAEVEGKEVEVTVTARELHKVYTENEVKGDKEYKGKILLVSGSVDEIKKDVADTIYVTLKTDEHSSSVQCYFSDDFVDQTADLKKGRSVKIKGKCDGLFLDTLVQMKGCMLVTEEEEADEEKDGEKDD